MHMADALISPAVGGALWAGSALAVSVAVKKVQTDFDDKKIPMMGVMGAFVFAAQMINFTIPGTGSSGHIGGGMLLAVLLGPFAGFLTMASVLLIQALFFADGGLLAYGCNLINMGFFTCFVAYPLVYRAILKDSKSKGRITAASVASVVVALQMGAFSVVIETLLSGKTEIPFGSFLLFMQPIHLAIGLVEGFITAAVAVFLVQARPDLFETQPKTQGKPSYRNVILVLCIAVVLIGGVLSWFASGNPDGLEWSLLKAAGTTEIESGGSIHKALSDVQEKTVILPDYQFKNSGGDDAAQKAGTSVSGLAGSLLTMGLVVLISFSLFCFKKRKQQAN